MLTNELFSSKVKILPTKSITVYNTQTLARSSYVTFLTFTTLWANSADNKMIIFSLFFPENRFDYFMQLSPKEAIYMNSESLIVKETICMKR